ncbi:MAG: histidine phosphatase family protein [Roseivirga sp.]|nr:histidine phosphatase family protein [Roseivirga sp.]
MKKLLIVRHAKSSWDDASLRDFDRPLNKRGIRDVPEMGKRLNKLGVKPDLIVSSPARRAITTARGIAHEIGYEVADIQEEPDLYHAGAHTIREIVSEVDNEIETLMIFGHNPGFTDLIARISDLNLYNLPTCAACGIVFDFDPWKEILNKRGKKFYYDYPKSASGSML